MVIGAVTIRVAAIRVTIIAAAVTTIAAAIMVIPMIIAAAIITGKCRARQCAAAGQAKGNQQQVMQEIAPGHLIRQPLSQKSCAASLPKGECGISGGTDSRANLTAR